MTAAAGALVEQLEGLRTRAEHLKSTIRRSRETLGVVTGQMKDLEQRLAALGVKYIVQQETADGATGSRGAVDHTGRPDGGARGGTR